jgi:hypothetical protein
MSHQMFARLGTQLTLILLASTALAGPRGTTLTGTKTAATSFTETQTYDWTITKSNPPDQVPYVIAQGDSQFATFSLSVEKLGPSITIENTDVTGEICLNNTGSAATRGLQLRDVLQVESSPGVWTDVTPVVAIAIGSQIAAGATQCYSYSFDIELDREKNYRNLATASIDNFYGYEGSPHEIEISAPVDAPSTTVVVDDSASIVDLFSCPSGFSCSPSSQNFAVNESTVIPVEIELTNDSVACGSTIETENSATLTEDTSEQERTSSAGISIYSGTCPIVPPPLTTLL